MTSTPPVTPGPPGPSTPVMRPPPYRPGTPMPPDDEVLLALAVQLRQAAARFVELVDGVRPRSRPDVWRGARADRFEEELAGHRTRLAALDARLHDVAADLESSVAFPLVHPLRTRTNLAAVRGNLGG